MSTETPKPKPDDDARGVAVSPKRGDLAIDNVSGRVKHDDRGNAIWEWAVTKGALTAESSAQRLLKLNNPSLALAEDTALPFGSGAVKENPLGTVKGYSPYDSGLLAKKDKPRKRKDLRKLGEWMKMRKQVVGNTPEKK